jgi:RNA-dependent RNA polymerase
MDELPEGRLQSSANSKRNDNLYIKVRRVLHRGIWAGGRHFEFLAFGNSQFRENGAYFFSSPNDELTCDTIRNWMGNFSHIDNVAKLAARYGLCFSTTRAIGSSGERVAKIPDVMGNNWNFTDGVGKISGYLMSRIQTALKLEYLPSVVQFRMAGNKGILTMWPDVALQWIHIRDSQMKFDAKYSGLEVIKVSQYSTATLNRQVIAILSALGVEDSSFMSLLYEQLREYSAAMTDPEKAQDILRTYVDENRMTTIIAALIADGFMEADEPFMQSLLNLWRAWSFKELKERARVVIKKSAFVLGCSDETGTLRGHNDKIRPGYAGIKDQDIEDLPQIFLQITDPKRPEHHDLARPTTYTVITGICLVGRNPSLHPGDLRVVEAVDVEALHHLKDVVVFPQNGDRDIPSMCSGGDLDGDDFFVMWDDRLIPKEWNTTPMDFTPLPGRKKDSKDGPLAITDIADFFVQYIKNDQLPTIAHAHLAMSDSQDQGVKDPKSLELAMYHSRAVDYMKSGQPAIMPDHLRPRCWPHFMEKHHKPKEQTYHSTKILGQMYDAVATVDFTPLYDRQFDGRILYNKAYPEAAELLKTARQLKSQYDIEMRRIIAAHGVGSEFEVWSTFCLSKPMIGSSYKFQEKMNDASSALKDQFKDICIESAGGREFEKLAPLVVSMYRVTHEEVKIAVHDCKTRGRPMVPRHMPLITFPWLFYQELGKIARRANLATDETDEDTDVRHDEAASTKARRIRYKFDLGEVDAENVMGTAEGTFHRGERLNIFEPEDRDIIDQMGFERRGSGHAGELVELDSGLSRSQSEESLDTTSDSLQTTTPDVLSPSLGSNCNQQSPGSISTLALDSTLSELNPSISDSADVQLALTEEHDVAHISVEIETTEDDVASHLAELSNLAKLELSNQGKSEAVVTVPNDKDGLAARDIPTISSGPAQTTMNAKVEYRDSQSSSPDEVIIQANDTPEESEALGFGSLIDLDVFLRNAGVGLMAPAPPRVLHRAEPTAGKNADRQKEEKAVRLTTAALAALDMAVEEEDKA